MASHGSLLSSADHQVLQEHHISEARRNFAIIQEQNPLQLLPLLERKPLLSSIGADNQNQEPFLSSTKLDPPALRGAPPQNLRQPPLPQPPSLPIKQSLQNHDTSSNMNLIGAFKNDCSVLKHTFKNAPHCQSSSHSSHVYPLLVTGVGRSATKYMADELVALGAQVSHDNSEVGRHGAVAWPLAIRETGHLDPELYDDGELAGHGMNGYELPSFLHNTARTVIGRNPSARFSIILHQVRLLETHNYSTFN